MVFLSPVLALPWPARGRARPAGRVLHAGPRAPRLCAPRLISTSSTPTPISQNYERKTSSVSTTRAIADRGATHSRAIGEGVPTLGSRRAVLASPLCRTVETAMLAFGAAQKTPAAREGGRLPPGSAGRFAALRALLSTPVAPGANTVIVAHAYPYFTLVGGQFLSEGEADVVRPRGTDFEVVARVGLRQWRELAATPAPR